MPKHHQVCTGEGRDHSMFFYCKYFMCLQHVCPTDYYILESLRFTIIQTRRFNIDKKYIYLCIYELTHLLLPYIIICNSLCPFSTFILSQKQLNTMETIILPYTSFDRSQSLGFTSIYTALYIHISFERVVIFQFQLHQCKSQLRHTTQRKQLHCHIYCFRQGLDLQVLCQCK